MNPVATQQVALDNSLVAPKKRPKIEKCNAKITFSKSQREETYQVTLDALKLSPCYPAFLITAEVPEVYMHQFWNTIPKIKDTYAYRFKLDKKKFRVDTEELGYSGKCDMLSAIHTDQMHQPWRTFTAIINRCISGKTTGLDRLRESRAQILWGMYNKKNVYYVALPWEDFMYQADNREISSARKEHMPYLRFTKVIINHFISKDKTIFMRNRINLHIIRENSLLGTLKFVSKTQDYQQYGALIPDDMINQDIKDSKSYKTYYDFATGKATPKKAKKYNKVASPSRKLSLVLEKEPTEKPKRARKPTKKSTIVPTAGVTIRDTPRESVSKKKTPANVDRGKGMNLVSNAALLEAAQVKEALQKSKKDSHILHVSGSGDRVGSQPKVLNESQDKTTSTDEGTGAKPEVLDVPQYLSKSENKSWGDSSDDGSNDDDSDEVTKDDDEDDFKSDNDDEEEYDELCKDVDVKSVDAKREKERKGDAEMTNADKNVLKKDHMSKFKFLNLDNVPPVDNEVASMMNVKVCQEESSNLAPPLLIVPVIVIPETSTIPTTEPTTSSIPALQDLASLFGFDQRVSSLEQELSQVKQVDHSTQILAQIPAIVDEHLSTRIRFATQTALQSYTAEFENKAQAEKEKYVNIIEKSVKEIIKDENVVLAKSSSQPQSIYEAATSLTEFELKKIMLDKLEKSKSYQAVEQHRDLYDALVKSYQLGKDLFDSYSKMYSLKRDCEDKDKDEDPSAGLD
ncbi:hypothetical protein Tco_0891399 [Tanacetum coccineum]|uniref:Uncharacterized protein n=1 Tax=Tanacetum coccineum TaxID=301880 RepID=A0ABQ5C5Z5_9ASTR